MSTRYLILSGATLVLLSCEEPKPKAVRFEVEATAAAPQDPLPGMVEGETRPVAVLVPDVGAAVRFVANELVLAADSAEAIDAAAVRLGAEVRALLDPVTTQLTGLKYLGLLRLQAPPADAASLADATVRLAAKDGAQPTGRYRVTSEPGLRLLALAAAEAEAGAAVAINWVLEGAAIPTNTQEAPTVDRGLSSDAYLWPHLGVATPQRFGVAEAWSLLHRAGKLGNRVRLAVLDSGFSDLAAPQQDIGVATALSVFPWHSAWGSNLGSCGSGDCPWHGQNVASTAMARVDDGFGGAGSAGPVAEPVLINTTYDYFTAISAVLNARAQGARVINMSFGASIPTIVAWTIYPFEATTALIRASGTLLFAAAGNSGENVDAEDCFAGICWESSWHTPCENNGVICVGGLGYNATVLDPGSNYGEEHVDVYGPYHVLVGPDPEHLANEARLVSGTSFSSPFAAGVAALVWAADPTLPASTVEEAVTRVSQASPEWYRPRLRWIRADSAVLYALKAVTTVTVTSPTPETSLRVDQRFVVAGHLEHRTFHTTESTSCNVAVVSDRSGPIASTSLAMPLSRSLVVASATFSAEATGLPPGAHRLTVTATCADAEAGDDDVTAVVVQVTNTPPVATIVQPTAGALVCAGSELLLRGTGQDVDQLAEGLPDAAFNWRSTQAGALGSGPSLVTNHLVTPGADTLALLVVDRYGATDEAQVGVTVLATSDARCTDTPPVVHITAPVDGAIYDVQGPDTRDWYVDLTLRGTVSDAQDPNSALIISWHSDVQGLLGRGSTLPIRLYVTAGNTTAHVLTLRVVDSAGQVTEDQVRIILSVFG